LNYKILGFSVIIASFISVILFSFTSTDNADLIKTDFIANLTPDIISDNLNYDNYELTSYLTNKKVSLSVYKGKILLLNFYEPWCSACNKEFFALNEFAQKYKNRVEVISVSSGEDMEMLNEWHSKWRYKNIKFYIDKSNKLTQYFKVRSIPATYLVNKNSDIHYQFIGDRNYLSLSFFNYIDYLLSK